MTNWENDFKVWELVLSGKCPDNEKHKAKFIINSNLDGNNEVCLVCTDCHSAFPIRASQLKEWISKLVAK